MNSTRWYHRAILALVLVAIARINTCHATEFDLPVGSAERTLHIWSDQSGMDILFDFVPARFYLTHAVRGSMSPMQALAQMLRGTNLTFFQVNETTAGVREAVTICRPYADLPIEDIPLPPCVQGPAAGEKRMTRL